MFAAIASLIFSAPIILIKVHICASCTTVPMRPRTKSRPKFFGRAEGPASFCDGMRWGRMVFTVIFFTVGKED